MYIAFKKIKGRPCFFLRESYILDNQWTFRDLFDLGDDPAVFVTYAGGNAFYIDEKITDALSADRGQYDSDELEDLFWPWIKPEIRQAVETFRNRASNPGRTQLTQAQKNDISASVHAFDKRRTHYLKFGTMDQGPVENMPPTLFRDHVRRSRDELEQYFFRQEFALKTHEFKSYVYTVFDLQRFFSGMLAKKMPQALDPEKVDTCFMEELCRLNKVLFNKEAVLDDYMIRYAVMFFDHPYAGTTLLDDFARNFMNRHRTFRPAPQKAVPLQAALKIFNMDREQLRTLTQKQLAKKYRHLARQVHPDKGGSHDQFVELNNAYETLRGVVTPSG